MLLLNNGDTAAAAGDHDLISSCKSTDGFDLHNINGSWSSNDTAEALSGFFLYIVALFYLNFSIISGHITADQLGRLIERFIIGIYRYLGQDGGNCFADAPAEQLCFQGILNIVTDITLAHGAAHAHGGWGIVNIKTAKLRHGLVDHTDLRPVAVGDGQLVVSLHQICKSFGGNLNGVPLLHGSVSECIMS